MEKKYLIVFSTFLVVMILLMISLIKYIKVGSELNSLNNMNKDIQVLEDSISIYYLDNSSLPIRGESIEFEKAKNPNDDTLYWEIDASKLDNLNLSYGNRKNGEDDVYIINNNSHTIYYLKGVKYKDIVYYTKDINYSYIDLEKYK